jgi:phosphatidylglycerol:prolipoprotein diacylglycerol transferase
MLSVGFAAFHVFGRIGCFLAGCCYGKVATWGFPVADDPSGALHVPIQLFESAMLVVIIMIILFKEYRIGTREYSCMLYLGLYAAGRFILEFYRGDDVRGIWGAFSTSQWISLIILCTILAKLITTNKQRVFRILNVAR